MDNPPAPAAGSGRHDDYGFADMYRQAGLRFTPAEPEDSGDDLAEAAGEYGVRLAHGAAPHVYTYTVGLTEHGLAEVRLDYLHDAIAAEIMVQVVASLIEHCGDPDRPASDTAHRLLNVSVAAEVGFDDSFTQYAQFSFRLPELFEPCRTLHAAWRHYGRTVPYVIAETPGWPCPRCANPLYADHKRCTCRFSCWYVHCDKLTDYQRSQPDSARI